jgi:hypothetical protein
MGALFCAHSGVVLSAEIDQKNLDETIYKVRIVRSQNENERNKYLEFDPNIEFKVLVDPNTRKAYATFNGTYQEKEHTLLWDSIRVMWQEGPKGPKKFSITVPILEKLQQVKLMSISPMGDVFMEKFFIEFKDWGLWEKARGKAASTKNSSWNVAIGPSLVSYSETLEPTFTQWVLTLKGGYQYSLNPKWSFGVSGYSTALPLASSVDGYTIRFLGINLRAGYALPWLASPWSLSLMGGFYYTTTLGSAPTVFGFENMYGPQLYPVITRMMSKKSSMSFYFKYALVSGSMNLTPQGSEMAAGATYAYQLRSGKWVSVGLDAARFSLNIDDLFYVQSSSLSLGLGFKW